MYKGRTYYLPDKEILKKLEAVLNQYKNMNINSNLSFDLANYLVNFYQQII